jgi:hypothetical protein
MPVIFSRIKSCEMAGARNGWGECGGANAEMPVGIFDLNIPTGIPPVPARQTGCVVVTV